MGEFLNRLTLKREYPLPAIDLSAMTGTITAIANDYGYEHVFSKQIKALGNSGDILIAISTSGSSLNVIKAIEQALENGMSVIFLTGETIRTGWERGEYGIVHQINIPSRDTPIIQEAHIRVIHALCYFVDKILTETQKPNKVNIVFYSIVWKGSFVRVNFFADRESKEDNINFLFPHEEWRTLKKALETQYTLKEY